jgi:hypothetical protein
MSSSGKPLLDMGQLGSIQGSSGFYETNSSGIFSESDMMLSAPGAPAPLERTGLGTFLGVFVPCVLSIFGVIIFERLGWVVGQVSTT